MFSPPLPTRAVAVSVGHRTQLYFALHGLPYKRVYYLHLSSWSATAKTNSATTCYNHGILRGSTDICTSLTFLGRACPQTFLNWSSKALERYNRLSVYRVNPSTENSTWHNLNSAHAKTAGPIVQHKSLILPIPSLSRNSGHWDKFCTLNGKCDLQTLRYKSRSSLYSCTHDHSRYTHLTTTEKKRWYLYWKSLQKKPAYQVTAFWPSKL